MTAAPHRTDTPPNTPRRAASSSPRAVSSGTPVLPNASWLQVGGAASVEPSRSTDSRRSIFAVLLYQTAEVGGGLMANVRLIFCSLSIRAAATHSGAPYIGLGRGHSLTPPAVSPCTRYRRTKMVKITTGSMTRVPPAAIL